MNQTIFLPKTDFPMKADLPGKEPKMLAQWDGLYEKLEKKNCKQFKILWGPPFANGHLHVGHALNGILKDILSKTYRMNGYDVPLIPIWDCHGLPIEWKVQEASKLDALPMIKKCREFASDWIEVQKSEFKRLGILADYSKPIHTMDKAFEALVVSQILSMLIKGQIKCGLKPVLWSVVEQTALAEAEVEYNDRTSDTAFIAFEVRSKEFQDTAIVIWTTTPWTIPANRAIGYHPKLSYVLIETQNVFQRRRFWVAKECLESFTQAIEESSYTILQTIEGSKFEGVICAHPFRGKGYDFDVPLLPFDHVESDVGTGFVHIAPSHGLEDFALSRQYSLEVPDLVKCDGTYDVNVPLFAGRHIYKVTPLIFDALKDALLSTAKLMHSYPHSWRSKAPLIYRTTRQWFVDLSDIRTKALDAIETVHWHPNQGKNRIKSMIENRLEWCLSRQRTWGVPIPFLIHQKTGEPLNNQTLNQRIVDLIKEHGIEGWHLCQIEDLLEGIDDASSYTKVMDIVDVWFESGCVHLLDPDADVYLEGSDQHRGWFQSSLLVSCSNQKKAPFKTVITHGFVLDEKGRKMSKSSGNTVDLKEIVEKKGADLLRLWVATSNYTDDLRIGDDILSHQEDLYRRFRNTLRYLLGGIDPKSDCSNQDLPDLERYILHRIYKLDQKRLNLNFFEFYLELHEFCSLDLSAFYFDIRKDTLYCDSRQSLKRISSQYVLRKVFEWLCHVLAPVLSFTAEEAWQYYNPGSSIHENLTPKPLFEWNNEALEKQFERIRSIRKSLTSALEKAREDKRIRSSLEAHLDLYVSDDEAIKNLDWSELCIVSGHSIFKMLPPPQATSIDGVPGSGVVVRVERGVKCQRCWKIVSSNPCKRCGEVLRIL